MKAIQPKRLESWEPVGASLTEAEMVYGYRSVRLVSKLCVCGTYIVADMFDPAEGVRLHNMTKPHLWWRNRQ